MCAAGGRPARRYGAAVGCCIMGGMSDPPVTLDEEMRVLARLPGLVVATGEGERAPPPWLACTLEVASPAELFSLLVTQRCSGALEVIDPRGKRSLFLEQGNYTGATSTHSSDRLHEVLRRMGKLSLDQILIADEMVKAGKLFGRAIIELGFIEPMALRGALVEQATSTFEAACLEQRGHAVFRADQVHPKPLRFGVETAKMIEGALRSVHEHRALERRIGGIDVKLDVVQPPPRGPLPETAQALVQLATSARKQSFTGAELIARAGLGQLEGLSSLAHLLEAGFLTRADEAPAPAPDDTVRLKRLVAAINLVMAALDDAGFGVGDAVREYLESPPELYEEALSGLTLEQPLDDATVLATAGFISGGRPAMITALGALLEDALLQAKDTLAPELNERLLERVRALQS